MSQSYRIETLGHFSTYGDSTKGDFLVTVAGDPRELKLFHDTSSSYDAPQVGDEFAGEIVQGKRGEWRLKRASRGSGGSTSSSSGGGSKTYERQPDHPLNMARALHTSALSSTPAFVDQLLTIGAVPQPTSEDEYWALVTRVCGRLKRSYPEQVRVQALAPAGGEGRLNGSPPQQPEIPADTVGLTPAPAGVDDDVPF
jgi:hypothetical protein